MPDGPLFNTHRRCETEGGYADSGAGLSPAAVDTADVDTAEFNLADAYYEVSGYALAIRQVLDLTSITRPRISASMTWWRAWWPSCKAMLGVKEGKGFA